MRQNGFLCLWLTGQDRDNGIMGLLYAASAPAPAPAAAPVFRTVMG